MKDMRNSENLQIYNETQRALEIITFVVLCEGPDNQYAEDQNNHRVLKL